MPKSSPQASADIARVRSRWRGMGAMLLAVFYSLYFSSHLQFTDTPIYLKDDVLSHVASHSIFLDLSSSREGSHQHLSILHPAFTIIHQPMARALSGIWQLLGRNPASAKKHAAAVLTSLAAGLIVVMVYHSLLWYGVSSLRAIFLGAAAGAAFSLLLLSALPNVWIFSSLGLASLLALQARGSLVKPGWQIIATTYALSCFALLLLPSFWLATLRFWADQKKSYAYRLNPILCWLISLTLAFTLANAQRHLYPSSAPMPKSWENWTQAHEEMRAASPLSWIELGKNALSLGLFPPEQAWKLTKNSEAPLLPLSHSNWHESLFSSPAGWSWLLLLVLGAAGLFWRMQGDPLIWGILGAFVAILALIRPFADFSSILTFSVLWLPLWIVLVGIGVERSLVRWPRLAGLVSLLLLLFVSSLIWKNLGFLQNMTA